MPRDEIQEHNIEEFLNNPTNWTVKQAIKQKLAEYENVQHMLTDVLADMKTGGAVPSYWAHRIEEALRIAQ